MATASTNAKYLPVAKPEVYVAGADLGELYKTAIIRQFDWYHVIDRFWCENYSTEEKQLISC